MQSFNLGGDFDMSKAVKRPSTMMGSRALRRSIGVFRDKGLEGVADLTSNVTVSGMTESTKAVSQVFGHRADTNKSMNFDFRASYDSIPVGKDELVG